MFSKTEIKLLIFISTKDGELYERQIANQAGISVGSANAILKAFYRLGFVKKVKKGRMIFYSRNVKNPFLRQFKVCITIRGITPLLEKLSPYSRRIILFGSCAEGRNTEKSDIDLFIISNEKEPIKRILDKYLKLQPIILNSLEFADLQKKDKPFYDRVMKGIELYGEEDG
ncbi:nucleotidyltransferase domain-containing protein [Candidatus Micrarchaeota archaeon]|nr:nucleotidyltransferase domain-containing protein [Candidatus Micrarchaeota archaeon]